MISLMKHGCPPQAIVATYGYDARTVYDWYGRGGEQCRQVHDAIVEKGRVDVQQVQADELCIRTVRLREDEIQGKLRIAQGEEQTMQLQAGELPTVLQEIGQPAELKEEEHSSPDAMSAKEADHMWMAMAMDVGTRLWLGGVVGVHRNRELILSLAHKVRSCAKHWNFLLSVDGLSIYITAFMSVFSWLIFTGKGGRPRRETVPGLMIVQVIKEYSKGRVTNAIRRIVRGSVEAVAFVLEKTGCTKINTSFIERLNATFRGRLATLVRRGRAIAHTDSRLLEQGMYLTGCTYNFCYFHDSLRVVAPVGGSRKWVERTPAMAAGLTDHRWTMKELLSYKVFTKSKTKIVHG